MFNGTRACDANTGQPEKKNGQDERESSIFGARAEWVRKEEGNRCYFDGGENSFGQPRAMRGGTGEEGRERNHLPVNQCGSMEKNKKNRAAQSNLAQHARHVASVGTGSDQPYATGIQIITKITASRGG